MCAQTFVLLSQNEPTMNVWNQMMVNVYGFTMLADGKTHSWTTSMLVPCLFILSTQTRHREFRHTWTNLCLRYHRPYRTIRNTWKYWVFSQYLKQATIFTTSLFHLANTLFISNSPNENASIHKYHGAKPNIS